MVAGSTLTVPEVKTSLNDASTFKPYDPSEITGPTTPSLPYIPPPDKGCDPVQMIITTVIAVVVSVYAPVLAGKMATWMGGTVAAAGATAVVGTGTTMAAHGIVAVAASAVTRGIASAVGLASFSWKDVAHDGITSALAAGLSGTLRGAGKAADTGLTYTYDAVKNVRVLNPLGRVLQGVGNYAGGVVANTVVGRNTHFSWSAVAATAVGSYVSAKLGGEVPGLEGGDITAVGLEGFGQNFVDGAVNASARRLFGLGSQKWGQIGFQALSSTIANEAAQGLLQWQAEKANRESQRSASFVGGLVRGWARNISFDSTQLQTVNDWQSAAGGMGSGIEVQLAKDLDAAVQLTHERLPDVLRDPSDLDSHARDQSQREITGGNPAIFPVAGPFDADVARDLAGDSLDLNEIRALLFSPEQEAEVDRLTGIRIPDATGFSCPVPGHFSPPEYFVGPTPTSTTPPSLEVQARIRKLEQEQNRAELADRFGNILALIPFFPRASNPINPNQLLNPINGDPVSYDEWVSAIADVGGSVSLRSLVPSRNPSGLPLPPNQIGSPYFVRIDPKTGRGPMSIDTAAFTSGPPTQLGGVRNRTQFWRAWSAAYPETLSAENAARIRMRGSPIVDQEWLRAFPEHRGYGGETIVHHHLDHGPLAIPMPASVHSKQPGWGIWHPDYAGKKE